MAEDEYLKGIRERTERRQAAELAAERTATGANEPDWKAKFTEEERIVSRIWEQLGNPTYEQLAGRSIFDLIDELKAAPAVPAPDKAQEEVAKKLAKELRKAARTSHSYSYSSSTKPTEEYLDWQAADLIEQLVAELSTAHASGREEGERAMHDRIRAFVKGWYDDPPDDAPYLNTSVGRLTLSDVLEFLPIPSPAQERGE